MALHVLYGTNSVCVAGLYVLQRIGSTQEGTASFALSGDFYNRELSGKHCAGIKDI